MISNEIKKERKKKRKKEKYIYNDLQRKTKKT